MLVVSVFSMNPTSLCCLASVGRAQHAAACSAPKCFPVMIGKSFRVSTLEERACLQLLARNRLQSSDAGTMGRTSSTMDLQRVACECCMQEDSADPVIADRVDLRRSVPLSTEPETASANKRKEMHKSLQISRISVPRFA